MKINSDSVQVDIGPVWDSFYGTFVGIQIL
jgi:hypothetical protein